MLLAFKLNPPPAFSNQYSARISEIPWYFPVTMTENVRSIANATGATRWHLFLCRASNSVGQIVFWAGGGMDFSLCVSEWWLLHPWYEIGNYKTLSLTQFSKNCFSEIGIWLLTVKYSCLSSASSCLEALVVYVWKWISHPRACFVFYGLHFRSWLNF